MLLLSSLEQLGCKSIDNIYTHIHTYTHIDLTNET